MSEETLNIILSAGIGAFVTLIGNYFFFPFQQKKIDQSTIDMRWWERKADAYTRIIEALYQLSDYYMLISSEYIGEIKISKERREELGQQFSLYLNEIRKVTYIGSFIISKEAETSLNKFLYRKRDEEFPDLYEEFFKSLNEAKICMQEIKECANKELKIKE